MDGMPKIEGSFDATHRFRLSLYAYVVVLVYLVFRFIAGVGGRTLETAGAAYVFAVPTYMAGYYLLRGIPVFEHLPILVSMAYPILSVLGSAQSEEARRGVTPRCVWWEYFDAYSVVVAGACLHVAEVRHPGFFLEAHDWVRSLPCRLPQGTPENWQL